jgi:hypothetical protein
LAVGVREHRITRLDRVYLFDDATSDRVLGKPFVAGLIGPAQSLGDRGDDLRAVAEP